MKDKPWIEDNDPLKGSYDLLSNSELISFLKLFNEWNNCETEVGEDMTQIKSGEKLIDFFNYSNDSCYLSLFEKLCSIMGGDKESVYWIPISDSKDILFQSFEPLMIAKTLMKKEILRSVSSSFMQMLNGGYMLFDSKSRFIGIILDGYYMLVFIKKACMNDTLNQYVENWEKLDQFLDPLLMQDLSNRVKNI
ncbi:MULTISPECIES: FAD-binding oxidoreductase [Acinetobacter]|jgi:hypothetical protein|uniref:FAD-binding oxidoreductase n=1 Tax=Acinetobacter TaxID=469 RepID=UPI000C6C3278|nr:MULTISPECIES: FAD-binding oxidoreductase [Acinetobacter]MBC70671.1 hypothetical protein [Acinetobacter sp.]MBT51577.1 hypothetical protein [Acinetobacter sp.]HIQ35677.1 FAD-binding oxidoreductase [Acinetobacter venetianus]|tara:strand:+ start:1541 stop:2119 length:579 start_codon:yes stop_codon:yes gene_type:complete